MTETRARGPARNSRRGGGNDLLSGEHLPNLFGLVGGFPPRLFLNACQSARSRAAFGQGSSVSEFREITLHNFLSKEFEDRGNG